MKKQVQNENIIYGIRAIEEALNDISKINSIEKIYVDTKKHRSFERLLSIARKNKISVQYVPDVKIEKLAKGKNHQGIAACILSIKYASLFELFESVSAPVRLILFLDRITDVRNFGSIARSAYAMGVDAILVPHKGAASINADAIKTSAGALLKIPVCKEQNVTEAIQMLSEKGFQIIACHEKTSRLIDEVDFTIPSVIILGSEHNGILKEYLKYCNTEAKIPMKKSFDSLNVSVSAGIVLYEIQRQNLRAKIV